MFDETDREGGPLMSLLRAIENGYFPAPEILLALRDRIRGYFQGNGDISLEEALVGPPRKKAGNLARRLHSQARKKDLEWSVKHFEKLILLIKKSPDTAGAMAAMKELGIGPESPLTEALQMVGRLNRRDPDSILRGLRRDKAQRSGK